MQGFSILVTKSKSTVTLTATGCFKLSSRLQMSELHAALEIPCTFQREEWKFVWWWKIEWWDFFTQNPRWQLPYFIIFKLYTIFRRFRIGILHCRAWKYVHMTFNCKASGLVLNTYEAQEEHCFLSKSLFRKAINLLPWCHSSNTFELLIDL